MIFSRRQFSGVFDWTVGARRRDRPAAVPSLCNVAAGKRVRRRFVGLPVRELLEAFLLSVLPSPSSLLNKAARVLYTGNRLCPNDLPMGLPCSTAACYRRFATTDEYDEDALWYTSRSSRVDTETFLTHQLGKFHYEVHALSMMLRPYDRCRTKAIYLYIDSVRVMAARATFDAGLVKYIAVQYR